MTEHRQYPLVLKIIAISFIIAITSMSCGKAQTAEPVQYLLRQILMEPVVSPERRAEILARADSCLAVAKSGTDFTQLAKALSEEPGADMTGGDLGYFSFGDMVESFSKTVFAMQPGEIAGPVETQFGFHIIKLLGIQSDTRRAQHILFMLEPGHADSMAVIDKLDAIRDELMAGADFDSILAKYSTVQMINDTRGYMVWQKPEDMLPSFAAAVSGLEPGDISKPFLSIIGFHIVKVDSINYDGGNLREGFPAFLDR